MFSCSLFRRPVKYVVHVSGNLRSDGRGIVLSLNNGLRVESFSPVFSETRFQERSILFHPPFTVKIRLGLRTKRSNCVENFGSILNVLINNALPPSVPLLLPQPLSHFMNSRCFFLSSLICHLLVDKDSILPSQAHYI